MTALGINTLLTKPPLGKVDAGLATQTHFGAKRLIMYTIHAMIERHEPIDHTLHKWH
ncbi:hypothetical protein [Psychrobacter celer]|uniref:hypothetical protein n=1 Tax=Psychrobacter celer TaxID=306572 RepID=UPI003FCF1D52